MNKEFVSYELALKELGFDEQCMRFYSSKNNGLLVLPERISSMHNTGNSSVELPKYCSAPLFQQAFKWFRDKHQLYHEILLDQTTSPKFCYRISRFIGNPDNLSEWDWESIQLNDNWGMYRKHNEAEIACLDKLIS